MTDWIELVLGEDGEEAENEERPALDGAAETGRPAVPRESGVEEEMEGPEALDAGRLDGADGPAEEPDGGTDWAEVWPDGTNGLEWTAEMEPGTGRTVWTPEPPPEVRVTGGGPEAAGAERDGLPGLELDAGMGGAALAGLAELYRGAAEGARAPGPLLAPERGSQTVLERGAGGSGGLTVEELDRAVRRDSRRYDGGMSIF